MHACMHASDEKVEAHARAHRGGEKNEGRMRMRMRKAVWQKPIAKGADRSKKEEGRGRRRKEEE